MLMLSLHYELAPLACAAVVAAVRVVRLSEEVTAAAATVHEW